MASATFDWDEKKNHDNQHKHSIPFEVAQHAFSDPNRVIAEDVKHSQTEKRYYCFGKVNGGIMTVRFTWRRNVIRIIGAGYWRKGKKIYEEANSIQ
jgi:uncharacterized DUF497 family protein